MVSVSANASQDESQHISHPRCVHTVTDRSSVSNAYLINGNRMCLVDPVSEIQVRLLAKYIQKFLHRSPSDIDLIVLTHLHQDHAVGIQAAQRICNAPVAALPAILTQQEPHIFPKRPATSPAIQFYPESFSSQYMYQTQLVNIWLHDVGGLPFHEHWRVIASPDYAPSCFCLYNPFTHELLSGDTVITIEGHIPLLRRGRDRRQHHETLRVLRSLPVYYLYPAHGQQVIGMAPLAHVRIE